MNSTVRTAAALLLSASLGGAGAQTAQAPAAGAVQAATPAAVAAGLREAGHRVTAKAAPGEAPGLTVAAGEYEFDLWFSGCQGGTCARVTASLGWELEGSRPDLAFLNDWNSDALTQAYTAEGAYFLDSTLTLRGGYTRAALKAWMSDYLRDVADFEEALP